MSKLIDRLALVLIAVFIILSILLYNKAYKPPVSTVQTVDTLEVRLLSDTGTVLDINSLAALLEYYEFPEPEIVIAQAILETGNFTSDLCLKYNNLFGLYNSRTQDFYHFDTWQHSVKAYRDYVLYKYTGGDYYEFLKALPYAEDSLYIYKLQYLVKHL